MTSENVDANGNSFKKLLNLLLLGSGASLFVGFKITQRFSLYYDSQFAFAYDKIEILLDNKYSRGVKHWVRKCFK